MSLDEGLNIIDEALGLAVDHMQIKGMPEQEAYVALLVRLWATVPEEVVEIAKLLRDDPDILMAVNGDESNYKPELGAELGIHSS